LYLSATPQTILALQLVGGRLRRDRLAVILHSIVETLISKRRSKAFWEAPLTLHAVVRFGATRGIKFVVLSERIYRAVQKLGLPAFRSLVWTDIPCFRPLNRLEPRAKVTGQPIRIGAIGVGHRAKGTGLLVQLARTLRNTPSIQLLLVGFVKDRSLSRVSTNGIEILSTGRPLGAQEMRLAIDSLDYSLFLFPPSEYVLTESASFSDAVSAAKPVIALESPLMQEKFRLFGNIGYLGKTIEKIACIVRAIGSKLPPDEYEVQQQHLLKAAAALSPERCARRLLSGAGMIQEETL
jgi:hypothetical protein